MKILPSIVAKAIVIGTIFSAELISPSFLRAGEDSYYYVPSTLNNAQEGHASSIWNVILGAIVAIGVAIAVEYLRKPALAMSIATPKEVVYPPDYPARRARYLYLQIRNKSMPRWARWMQRNALLECHGEILFRKLEGDPLILRAMAIRWHGPDPQPMVICIGCQKGTIYDMARFQPAHISLYPGEPVKFTVAARFDSDADCYGWCDENYLSDPQWRNQVWKIPRGSYRIDATIRGGGLHLKRAFLLLNPERTEEFRIEEWPY
jgi:hypothetical protein